MAVQPNPETLRWAIERSGNTVAMERCGARGLAALTYHIDGLPRRRQIAIGFWLTGTSLRQWSPMRLTKSRFV